MLVLAQGHEQVNYPHDPSSCSHHHHLPGVAHGQMEAQHPTAPADLPPFWFYKCITVDAVICNLQPTNSPRSSYACIRPPGLFRLCFCAALTFCLCLFESRPRSGVLVLRAERHSPIPPAVRGVSKWGPPPTSAATPCRLLHGPRVSYPQCNLSFFVLLLSSLFFPHCLYLCSISPLISHSSVLRETILKVVCCSSLTALFASSLSLPNAPICPLLIHNTIWREWSSHPRLTGICGRNITMLPTLHDSACMCVYVGVCAGVGYKRDISLLALEETSLAMQPGIHV